MEQITSLQNPRIRQLRMLQEKKCRQETGRFLLEGSKMIEEALAHTVVHTVIVEEERAAQFATLINAAADAGASIIASPRHVLEALSATKTPQGIVAEVDLPGASEGECGERMVALDGVQDPGNVGTILRTADAAGFNGMLFGSNCADVFASKTLRATMGSIFRVPVFQTLSLAERLLALRAQGYAILSSQLDGEDFFARPPMPSKLVLVIGSEADGVSNAVAEVATHRLRLPMQGGAESLNAAVAAGIMLYDLSVEEWGRKRCK